MIKFTKEEQAQYKELEEFTNNHIFWKNKLLQACEKNLFSVEEFKYIFSQYYHYSRNFTKFLAVALLKNNDDFYRAKLTENLWEESGEKDIKNRHAEMFREFLTQGLKIDLNKIVPTSYAELYVNKLLEFCLNSKDYECFSSLSFGTEGIVPRLYQIFVKGMLNAGIENKKLKFFNVHIECDDDHALTLAEMSISHNSEPDWLNNSKTAIDTIMNLRNDFFNCIYDSLQKGKLEILASQIQSSSTLPMKIDENIKNTQTGQTLYRNNDQDKGINFSVDRINFKSSVLDPRIVIIEKNCTNEMHNHAHETVFFILEGKGKVFLDGFTKKISKDSIVFVPRWKQHQIINTGSLPLKYLAVTDYNFTKRITGNTDFSYREKIILQ